MTCIDQVHQFVFHHQTGAVVWSALESLLLYQRMIKRIKSPVMKMNNTRNKNQSNHHPVIIIIINIGSSVHLFTFFFFPRAETTPSIEHAQFCLHSDAALSQGKSERLAEKEYPQSAQD